MSLRHARAVALALLALAACADEAPRSDCPPDEAYFEARVWQPVLSRTCVMCHVDGGPAGRSDFVLTPAGASGAAPLSNLPAARAMALATEDGEPLLLRRPLGIEHPGGMVVTRGSPEHQALVEFVGRVRGEPGACDAVATCQAGDPGPRLLRRLSRAEYDETLRALFAVDAHYAPGLAADVVVEGFDNNAAALTVSPLLAEQLRQAAEEVAATVAARPDAACAGDGLTCAGAWLDGKGARVLRRPLTARERTRWLAVYQAGRDTAAGEPPHQAGLSLMIAGLLQSPAFLYRSELGVIGADGRAALTSFEIASELSYFLWSAPPDDQLWQLAVEDRLRDPAVIAEQARRLLAAPQARTALDRFTDEWLGVDLLAVVARDVDAFPTFTPAVRASMAEEVHRGLAGALARGDTVADLLTARTTWLDRTLADFYGLPAPTGTDAGGFAEVDAGSRAGLLGTGAILATHARANSTSPVHRGKLVRERLLCQPLPPPPPGVVAQPPPLDPSLTARDRYEQHASDPACASCHERMDPIGFALEHFDGVGRWRADEQGLAIDDSGAIVESPHTDGTFIGLAGLSAQLATSPDVKACFARQWLRWAYGVDEDDPRMACLAAEVEAEFATHGVIEELVVALTASVHFRFRQGDGAVGPGPGTDGGLPPVDAGVDAPTAPGGDSPGVTVSLTRTSEWPTGYCAALVVTNTSTQPVTWRVTRTVEGAINNHWNCETSASAGTVTFTGAPHNVTLAPGGRADAGFCAQLP